MTPKQEERIRKKIKRIKADLAADKRHWGGQYHDGGGLRYLPPALYIKLGDYTGGLRYLNWFTKNFSDDAGFPDFLFECTIILFKSKRLEKAEKMAFRTFCSNTYLFDKFLGKPVIPIDKEEYSNLDKPQYVNELFEYSHADEALFDFAHWLNGVIKTEKFKAAASAFIEVQKKLKREHNPKKRKELYDLARKIELEY